MDFREFVRYHKSYLIFFGIIILAMLAVDGFLLYKRNKYITERDRLRAGMSDFEREKTDVALQSEESRMKMMVALIRRQSKVDKKIHLAISTDSGRMYLEREGAMLRGFPILVGAGKRVGVPPDTVHPALPRGERSVQRILGTEDGWEIPAWVYTDRGLAVPAERTVKGALGPVAVILNGGTVIYSPPTAGPLNDSAYVLPGSVRASAVDLKAVAPNLKAGMTVYFY
ncbi:MAG: hypothetical protein ACR2G6_16055 [Gemmatimonadaceae bacterium]